MIGRIRVLVFNKSCTQKAYEKIVDLLLGLNFVVSKTELEDIFKKNNTTEPKLFDVAVIICNDGKFRITKETKNAIELISTRNLPNDLYLLKLRLLELQKS